MTYSHRHVPSFVSLLLSLRFFSTEHCKRPTIEKTQGLLGASFLCYLASTFGGMGGPMRSLVLALTISNYICDVRSLTKPHVTVVGAGFGGWGAVKALCENGCRVTLLDVLPDPTGATPYVTSTGKPFEAGTKGFWMDYPNINNLLKELSLKENDIFTPCTNSSFYSPAGLEATAPVFSSSAFPKLPSPLGQVFATQKLFERLPLADRASMAGLLYATIDFTRNEKVFAAYDKMTAHELFVRFGLSKRLVDDFIRPTLLVGLFKPPEELSAAVTMELLYYYALAHQTSFDVRWIKGRSIAETIIAPMAKFLKETYGEDFTVLGNARVESLSVTHDKPEKARINSITYTVPGIIPGQRDSVVLDGIDACVLALGSKGLKNVLAGSPEVARISPELTRAASMQSIDVIACRMWLDKKVQTRSPANVFAKFDQLRGAGGTFFMLDQLQGTDKEGEDMLWGESKDTAVVGDKTESAAERGSVVACDFYNAGALLPLSDKDIITILTGQTGDDSAPSKQLGTGLLPSAVPAFKGAKVVDFYVQRYPGAVSWFSPGSYALRPPLELKDLSNCVCAGDWVRMGDREHGAKGLCQERAFVSGLEAANALSRSGALSSSRSSGSVDKDQRKERQANVIPIRDDEIQFTAARNLNKNFIGLLGENNPFDYVLGLRK